MNKLLILIFSTFLTFTASANAKDLTVTVKGMVCGFCAQGITKKFKALPEVENVEVSLGKKIVSLKIKEGKDLSDATITGILTESGYNVEKIER
jgi:copper chaperone CopZ